MDPTLPAAFIIGLFSAPHCIGMCGSIMGALSYGLPEETRQRPTRLLLFLLAYNIGRIASYAVAGALAGTVGAALLDIAGPGTGRLWLQRLTALFMVVIGLHIAGWLPGLARVERIGLPLWRRLEPLGRRMMPVRSPLTAAAYGGLWGWLPCGLVYTMLISAGTRSTPLEGALYLGAFGLGTLPAVVAAGLLTGQLYALIQKPYLKVFVGVIIIAIGIMMLLWGHSGMPSMV